MGGETRAMSREDKVMPRAWERESSGRYMDHQLSKGSESQKSTTTGRRSSLEWMEHAILVYKTRVTKNICQK
jgi:hypothetical protein